MQLQGEVESLPLVELDPKNLGTCLPVGRILDQGNLLHGRGRESTPSSVCKSELSDSEFLLPRLTATDRVVLGPTGLFRLDHRTYSPDSCSVSDGITRPWFLLRVPQFVLRQVAWLDPKPRHHTSNAMKHQLNIYCPFR